ncbi:hypothetical protein P0W64_21715 [Tsukamurella sp. 8F]|uniref:hypothetical protein n=1 Tax=unclassified Tsukamurella TaxID=2633480 RepID=UPI0023B94D75|nr:MULTISPECIES: hypothetical protein [unclassified Tsukamurella]MDF0532518.1 hypothetical protein [Tsukamurella sp. 8J]MDF0589404.1 hypothetical protein [Tsukamurella sp. 8F]
MANQSTPSKSTASTTARAVETFVAAVEARGGKAETTTRGNVKIVKVTADGAERTVRVKGTTKEEWTARRSESVAGKSPVDAWALIDLTEGAPVALVSGKEYATFVSKQIGAWESRNPGKQFGANSQVPVTGDDVAGWEGAWNLLGLPAEPAGAKPAAAKPVASKGASKPASSKTAASKPAAKKPTEKKAPAKPAAAKTATSKPASKTTAAKPAAKKPTPAKPDAKADKGAAKITPIAEQQAAASKAKSPYDAADSKATDSKATKAGSTKAGSTKAAAGKPAAAKDAPAKDAGKAKDVKGAKQPTGIAVLLKRLPVVGRLI